MNSYCQYKSEEFWLGYFLAFEMYKNNLTRWLDLIFCLLIWSKILLDTYREQTKNDLVCLLLECPNGRPSQFLFSFHHNQTKKAHWHFVWICKNICLHCPTPNSYLYILILELLALDLGLLAPYGLLA